MHQEESGNLTLLINAAGHGDERANQLAMEKMYAELKQIARQQMRLETPNSLQPTALIHEAYLKLIGTKAFDAKTRGYFFAAASRAMRQILIEYARKRNAAKRGGRLKREPLGDVVDRHESLGVDPIDLDDSLRDLEQLSPRQASVVNMRWFGELSVSMIADALGVSVSTVEADWRMARAYLFRRLKSSNEHRDC